jgi:hypothetical protein
MPEYSFVCENPKCGEVFFKIWSFSEYDKKLGKISCPSCKSKKISRDYVEDGVVTNYIKGLHECQTLGEYADKQTKKFWKEKCNEMLRNFKTKKDPNTGMKELPSGMSRAKDIGDMPRISRKQAKNKRGKK